MGLVLPAASYDVPLLERQFSSDKAAVYPRIIDIVQLSCHRKSPITHPPKFFRVSWVRPEKIMKITRKRLDSHLLVDRYIWG